MTRYIIEAKIRSHRQWEEYSWHTDKGLAEGRVRELRQDNMYEDGDCEYRIREVERA